MPGFVNVWYSHLEAVLCSLRGCFITVAVRTLISAVTALKGIVFVMMKTCIDSNFVACLPRLFKTAAA